MTLPAPSELAGTTEVVFFEHSVTEAQYYAQVLHPIPPGPVARSAWQYLWSEVMQQGLVISRI